jgi:hypothetical protein
MAVGMQSLSEIDRFKEYTSNDSLGEARSFLITKSKASTIHRTHSLNLALSHSFMASTTMTKGSWTEAGVSEHCGERIVVVSRCLRTRWAATLDDCFR